MDAASPVSSKHSDVDLRQRAKERLYVICQLTGWLLLLFLQLAYLRIFKAEGGESGDSASVLVQGTAVGLLVTHYGRYLLHRWGWKELSWWALAPRILGMGILMAFVYSSICYTIHYPILGHAPSKKYSVLMLFGVSMSGMTIQMSGWLCLYFFYHLFDRYNRLQIEQLKLSAAVKEAELRALKSQINPHFIFNSLNSLRGLIDEDPSRARQAVTQLANLLRYSLQSGQLETVSFGEELRTVNDYLALEQVRHEERLQVRIDVAPGVLGFAVPPMLLQTLVENAVKYGIAPRREGGEIAITAHCDRSCLRIEVTNPGTLAAGGGSTGVGLRNAADRLKLLFGAQATLSLREDPPGNVVAEVVVPVESVATGSREALTTPPMPVRRGEAAGAKMEAGA